MKPIFFTKFLKGLSANEIAELAAGLGVAGLDLAIRAGHAVHPDNVTAALPEAIAVFRQAGLTVPLVTLETSAVIPWQEEIEAIFAACGAAGIPFIKLGYWHWRPGEAYREGLENARVGMAAFQKLGEKHGVCGLVHTHSGDCYGCNATGALQLVEGFNSAAIGIYLDPAHLALCGESFPMAASIAGEYLKMIAVKNARYQLKDTPSGPRWQVDWCSLEEGLVHWPTVIRQLKEIAYAGPLSVHGEYSGPDDTAAVLQQAARDVEYLQGAL